MVVRVVKVVVFFTFIEAISCYNDLLLVVLEKESLRAECSSLIDSVCHISDAPLVLNKTVIHTSPTAVISPGLCRSSILDEGFNKDILTVFSFLEARRIQKCAQIIANAFIELLRYYRWTEFILYSDNSHSFYVQAAQYLYNKALQNVIAVDYIQVNKDFNDLDILRNIGNQSKRIIFLSMPSKMVAKMLHIKRAYHMNWQEYAWIVHSVYRDSADEDLYEGIIELKANINISSELYGPLDEYLNKSYKCLSNMSESVNIYLLHYKEGTLHLSNYSETSGYYQITLGLEVPRDSTLQPVPIIFNALFSLGILVCFILVTSTLVLYIRFRNEPAIKATSISLSSLIFIGCYTWVFYLCILNFSLLPGYHKRASSVRNGLCLLRSWLHGLGYPVVLIMCTTLVKMVRIYRIFYCQGRLNKYLSGNLALALYSLVLTSPNALICIVWLIKDPFLSHLYFTTINGHRHIMERCQSESVLRWLLGLLIHVILLALALLIIAFQTRNIKLYDFKNSTQIRAFSLCFLLTTSAGVVYWYALNIAINANVFLVHASLQIVHYCLICQILAFLFVPKLYPILKYKFMKKCGAPVTKRLF